MSVRNDDYRDLDLARDDLSEAVDIWSALDDAVWECERGHITLDELARIRHVLHLEMFDRVISYSTEETG